MSFLTELKSLFFQQEATPVPNEQKAIAGFDALGRTQPLTYSILNGSPATPLTRDDAQLNVVFGAILNGIQTAAKSIPWNVYQLQQDENAQKVQDHPLGRLLYRPNPQQSWGDFVTQYLGHLISTGNVFILAIRNEAGLNKGQVQQLWVMPTSTEILPSTGWMTAVRGYRVAREDGGYDTFRSDEVLHLKKFNLGNSPYGLSPITAGTLPLTSITYALNQRIQQLANGGPKTVFFNANEQVDGTLTEEQEHSLYAKLNRRGAQATYLDSKIGSAQLGLSPVDLDLLNSVQADAGLIADLLNYPSILLSGTKSSTYNNVAEAQKALYTNCVIPHLHELRDGLNFKFGGAYKDKVYIDLDLSGIEVLKPNVTALITAANSADFLTTNEKRRIAGFPVIPGADGYVLAQGQVYYAKLEDAQAAAAA